MQAAGYRRVITGACHTILRAELSLANCTHKAGYRGSREILMMARLSTGELVAQDGWPDEEVKS